MAYSPISTVQFSRSVVSDSLRPHELQHSRPPCPSPTPEATQTHVHLVSDTIQPSHPLSSPSPPVLNFSQHQGLFKWVSPSHQEAKVLELQLQYQSSQWTPRTDLWVRMIPWRREWQPTPVFLPGESHGQRSLAGYSPQGHKELDTTESHTRTRSNRN